MSAIAGRVLILPKGDYDASVTYEFLDLVNHKSSSWLAKKASTGIEPSDENSEFWQKFGSSVTPDGVTIVIDENGVISAVGGTAEKVTYENESVADVTNVKEALDGIIGDYLPLSGGTLEGYLKWGGGIGELSHGSSGVGFRLNHPNTDGIYTNLIIDSVYGLASRLALYTNESGSLKMYDILHTGNKPSGTYTGNGSATERRIAIGGSVSVNYPIIITSSANDTVAIVTRGGTFCADKQGNVTKLSNNAIGISSVDGVATLIITTNNGVVNANGVVYTYNVS